MEIKKLYRSETDKVIAGVLGGLAEHANIDSTILRLGYVLLALVTAVVPALIVYFIACIVIPVKPKVEPKAAEFTEQK